MLYATGSAQHNEAVWEGQRSRSLACWRPAALVLAGNLLAVLPSAVAARTRAGVSLRTE